MYSTPIANMTSTIIDSCNCVIKFTDDTCVILDTIGNIAECATRLKNAGFAVNGTTVTYR